MPDLPGHRRLAYSGSPKPLLRKAEVLRVFFLWTLEPEEAAAYLGTIEQWAGATKDLASGS
jgi:hypothetical protein